MQYITRHTVYTMRHAVHTVWHGILVMACLAFRRGLGGPRHGLGAPLRLTLRPDFRDRYIGHNYLGIADGMSIARVRACRYSK